MKIQLRIFFAVALSTPVLGSVAAQPPSTGSFLLVGSMSQFRKLHTATLLSNGEVLVTGGGTSGTAFTEKAEVYDSAAKNWNVTGGLSFSRAGHLGVSLANGKVLVTGGFNGSMGLVNNSELYDPVGGIWQLAGGLNTPRQTATATLLRNGKVLAAGGAGNSFLSSAEVFDPASGNWTLPVPCVTPAGKPQPPCSRMERSWRRGDLLPPPPSSASQESNSTIQQAGTGPPQAR